jgi:hypothetical protein
MHLKWSLSSSDVRIRGRFSMQTLRGDSGVQMRVTTLRQYGGKSQI